MTNHERIQARIARDKQRKEAKRAALAEEYGRLGKVITMQHLFKSFVKRRKGTDWKQSVMDFSFHAIVKIKRLKDAVLAGILPEPTRIQEIYLYERGKRRRVHAVAIDSRVVQGALCDYCITPLTRPGLINDNPASTKGKGVSWARERMDAHIHRQFKRTGRDTWALVFDLRGFFDSIRHDLCEKVFREIHMDEGLIALAMHFIKMYQVFAARKVDDAGMRAELMMFLGRNEGVGVSLGSQVSQDMALCTPNDIDHAAKDKYRAGAYMRYMDDGVAMGTRAEMEALRDNISAVCQRLGFRLHETKTQVVRLSKGFTYLKIRYEVEESGRIIKRMARAGIVRARRKVRKLRDKVLRGEVTRDDVFLAVKSWIGNAKKYSSSFRSRKRLMTLYYQLFKGYRMEGARA